MRFMIVCVIDYVYIKDSYQLSLLYQIFKIILPLDVLKFITNTSMNSAEVFTLNSVLLLNIFVPLHLFIILLISVF